MPLSAVTVLELSAVFLVGLVATDGARRVSDPGVGSRPPLQMSVARAGHTATRLADGTVLIAGGMVRNGEILASAELYDPLTGSFRGTGAMPVPRVGHTATLLGDGRVLILGGRAGAQGLLADALLYTPGRGEFGPAGRMAVARSRHTATVLADGRVLIAGGETAGEVATAGAELFDPATGRFSAVEPMASARAYHSAARLPDGRVLVVGGGPDPRHVLATAELFSPASGRFTPTAAMRAPRRKFSATPLQDGEVLVAGGADTRDYRAPYDQTELYDPRSQGFAPGARMRSPRFKHAPGAVLLPDGSVLIAGGGAGVERFDPAARRFELIPEGPTAPRYYATATLLGDGSVLIAGGYGENGQSDAGAWVVRGVAGSR
jgi:hypothetical protein